ncbi:hypothetical protein LguiA_018294 [Lonicera macranthoides]
MIAQMKFDKDHSINIRSSQRSIETKTDLSESRSFFYKRWTRQEDHSHHSQASNANPWNTKIKNHMPKLQGKASREESI